MSTPSRPSDQLPSELNSPPTSDINQNEHLSSTSLSSAVDTVNPTGPAKKRRVQWVGLSENEQEQRSSVQSHGDPFQSALDIDSPTPTPTPLTASAGASSFLLPVPTTGILSRRTTTEEPSLSLSLPNNPYFPPLPPGPDNHNSRTDHPQFSNSDRPFRQRADSMATPDSSRPVTPDSDLDIPFGERDGLPSDPNRRPRTFTREAAKLVSLHKFKLGVSSSRRREPTLGTAQAGASGALGPIANAIPRSGIPVGKGVLSSLLGLYNQPTSAQSSSATLLTCGSDDDSEAGNGRPRSRSSFDKTSQRLTRGWAKVAVGLTNERPAAARSGAGVIGALQASAMGLAGVATPAANTVAPVVHKPGFRLGRYSPAGELPPVEATLRSDNPYEMKEVDHARRQAGSASLDDMVGLRRAASEGVDMLGSGHDQSRGQSSGVASSASSLFGVSIGGKPCMSKSGSLVNLRTLGDVLNPQTYHNESAVLRAKRAGGGMSSGSTPGTPREDPFTYEKEKDRPTRHNASRRRLEKRRQEEIFITMHVAAILQRQQFILQLTRAMMMFGGPSHRLESQIQSTARVLEIDLQMVMIHS
ncbi:hypothetical protein CROQUDRAFT_480959 [Cronartium quercuum f. sp. fusiforme G11]|uniref:Uncharacterized protein n=1 Tax=Cronartium quercuum f. sp. fusiforme G11 TaxID=708437 RepID=A0A9P6NHW2_9BASI|nr:hypothetical protein CROQUDRAFT_480959 [Cronartium quercuum f. sp. fusiforme G11]